MTSNLLIIFYVCHCINCYHENFKQVLYVRSSLLYEFKIQYNDCIFYMYIHYSEYIYLPALPCYATCPVLLFTDLYSQLTFYKSQTLCVHFINARGHSCFV